MQFLEQSGVGRATARGEHGVATPKILDVGGVARRHPYNIAPGILDRALYCGTCEQRDVPATDMRLKRGQECIEY